MFVWRKVWFSASAAVVLVLGGCNTTGSLKSVETSCIGQYHSYSDAWNCVRNQNNLTYDDYRSRYIANGDDLLAQVNSGQISDADARASMSSGFSSRGGGGGDRGGGGGRR
jgi:hypothetical protein